MKIRIARTGGFAGLSLRATIDVDLLPPAERADVLRLAAEADLAALPADLRAAAPDRFRFELEWDGMRLAADEAAAPAPLRALFARLIDLARGGGPGVERPPAKGAVP